MMLEDYVPGKYTPQQKNELKGHHAGLHGFGERIYLCVDTQDQFAIISFEQEKDAKAYIKCREEAGWGDRFQILERLHFKDAQITAGPTITNKRPNCPMCQDMVSQY